MGLGACLVVPPSPPDAGIEDAGIDTEDGGLIETFDDHTLPRLESVAAFEAHAAPGAGSTVLKVVVTGFSGPAPSARFLDTRFFTLHDEWYWFRLLNGARVPGSNTPPVAGLSFASIADIYAWARLQDTLPLDLRFLEGRDGGRLYSPAFYAEALDAEPRRYGLATLDRFPARDTPDGPRAEIWAFELEYSDAPTVAEIAVFFETLEARLPPEVGTQLRFLLRSPAQEALAAQMATAGSPYAARVLRYEDVTVPGEKEVYSEGLIAGRLRVVRRGSNELANAGPGDVLVVEDTPDSLPQCAGLLTSTPQTALAHVNVLARNRGIPNAYVNGVLDDPNLDQLARVAAPVILRALAPNQVELVPISEGELARFRALSARSPSSVRQVAMSSIEETYDLASLDFADAEAWRAIIGGKAAGYLALLDTGDISLPDAPMAISIEPYVEHIAALRPRLTALLDDDAFVDSTAVRYLALEGIAAYDAMYPTASDKAARLSLLAGRAPTDPLRTLVEEGGVRDIIRHKPIAPATLGRLLAALETQFGRYADKQGLRFRSSSSVEDIEGFNGAGLYTSNTGYLHAERLSGNKREKTVETALRETWASYWRAEAFEERRLARVDHLSGNMAAVVHARFDDDKELANGVFTVAVLPPESADAAVLELNVQPGAEASVTNPVPGSNALPEIDRVIEHRDGSLTVERVRPSTEMPAGELVVTDDELRDLFDQGKRVTAFWLASENSTLSALQKRRTLTLDFEVRRVAAAWPALATGTPYPSRLVVKQARTLEPTAARAPASVRALPLPVDVLARSRRVEQRVCTTGSVKVTTLDAYTDPLKTPDLGYARAPFTAFVTLDALRAIPTLGLAQNARRSALHPALATRAHPGMTAGGAYALDATVVESAQPQAGFAAVTWSDTGAVHVENAVGVFDATGGTCTTQVLFATPEDFLLSLLEGASR